jgi:hypothetical protein
VVRLDKIEVINFKSTNEDKSTDVYKYTQIYHQELVGICRFGYIRRFDVLLCILFRLI